MISLVATLLAAEPYLELREQARGVLQRECGTCHNRALKTANAKALKIFDLTKGDFAAEMSEPQLSSAKSRLASDLKEDATPRDVPKADQERFARFVEAELARRKR
jgi:hypothetical protein